MITIVDYGMGNLGSIKNMLRYIGVESTVSGTPEGIAKAERLILPGVGAFDVAMACLNNKPALLETLNRKVLEEKVPILGICLGMQLLTVSSEEGGLPGLGWIDATTKRFPRDMGLKVPHMGWNVVTVARESPLTAGFGQDETRFYFVHSYCVRVADEQDSMFKAHYGFDFDAGIAKDNIFGVQFHPEKSHKFGMKFLRNFAEYARC